MQNTDKMNQVERLISEMDLLKLLGLKRSELDKMRRDRGLPYVKLSQRTSAYFISDILEWGRNNRVTSATGQ